MSLWKYKYFLDVVELKSFTKAGARNYVTQTAVSQQIASLEKMAGGNGGAWNGLCQGDGADARTDAA